MLSRIKILFFPFYKKNLILKKYWWHRLLTVLFVLVVIWGGFRMYFSENRNADVYRSNTCWHTVSSVGGIKYGSPFFQSEYDKCLTETPQTYYFFNLIPVLVVALIFSYGLQFMYFKIFYYIIFGKHQDLQKENANSNK